MASRRSLTLRKGKDTEAALESFVLNDDLLNSKGQPAWSTSPIVEISLDKIILPEFQLRLYYDREKIEQIKATIQSVGIREPLLLRPIPGKGKYFELIAGSQRRLAAEELGHKIVPAKVDEVDDLIALKIAIIENEARSDINPFERTRGIIQLLSTGLQMSKDEVSQILTSLFNAANRRSDNNVIINDEQRRFILSVFEEMGLNWKSFVANKLQLINLPNDVVAFLESGKVSYTKAIRIARVKDEDIREELLQRVVAEELTVKQLQSLITTVSSKTTSSEEIILRDRARSVLKRATSPKLLKDKKIRKKVESLTNQLESLISECE
ncbi:ParB/RepB/Spo0J family partition protein (plasmid) [Acaryochloris sp. 'Moss Beach']|uniref:ParB/RepB/Spo0J family partition protein n=1 Tax=Acaryochloris TaxID=155977 RepID=UPI001BB0C3B6|nr:MULTISPECIES: ParB/RepB/Spo0J family partition protein [Acaryochloris]QUY40317.1 ParB/RepB/Spo0J family partition protein [Acaryochloris marina S15]UJB72268.1 ParB/RepB/Spo0J family partition protein [Acaryochloris sp. 'Moss Beach']